MEIKINYVGNLKETIGRNAAICYQENIDKEYSEPSTYARIADRCIKSGHHSVMEHIMINMEIRDIPKDEAFILNRFPVYATSERSARYTDFTNMIEDDHVRGVYTKWIDKFTEMIKDHGESKYCTEKEIHKKALENARYLLPCDVKTNMRYSMNLREFCYMVNVLGDSSCSKMEFYKCITRTLSNNHLVLLDIVEKTKPNNLLYLEYLRRLDIYEIEMFTDVKTVDCKKYMVEGKRKLSFSVCCSDAVLNQLIRHRSITIISIKRLMEIANDRKIYVPQIARLDKYGCRFEFLDDATSVMNRVGDIQANMYYVTMTFDHIHDINRLMYSRLCRRALLEFEDIAKRMASRANEVLGDNIIYTKPKCFIDKEYCTEYCKQRMLDNRKI